MRPCHVAKPLYLFQLQREEKERVLRQAREPAQWVTLSALLQKRKECLEVSQQAKKDRERERAINVVRREEKAAQHRAEIAERKWAREFQKAAWEAATKRRRIDSEHRKQAARESIDARMTAVNAEKQREAAIRKDAVVIGKAVWGKEKALRREMGAVMAGRSGRDQLKRLPGVRAFQLGARMVLDALEDATTRTGVWKMLVKACSTINYSGIFLALYGGIVYDP